MANIVSSSHVQHIRQAIDIFKLPVAQDAAFDCHSAGLIGESSRKETIPALDKQLESGSIDDDFPLSWFNTLWEEDLIVMFFFSFSSFRSNNQHDHC
jgi:hypothetical protein